jgi:plasmid stabilization system protein ParE
VKTSARAERDLIEIYEFIFLDSPQNAEAVRSRLESEIDSLATFPHRYKIFEPNTISSKVVRSMPVPPFAVYYLVEDGNLSVDILTIRRGTRDRPRRFFG